MGVPKQFRKTKNLTVALFVLIIQASNGINLGLIAGDLKRHTSPLLIRKVSRHSPVFITINSGLSKLPSISIPKLPPKLPQLKLIEPKVPELLPKPSRKLPRSVIPPVLLPPIIPRLPLLPILPIIPPILPPILPRLPIIPRLPLLPRLPLFSRLPLFPRLPLLPRLPVIPRLPLLPNLLYPLRPLRVPILGKSQLQKALGSELQPVTNPFLAKNRKDSDLEKLLDLKKRGSLTTAEFIRFKKRLLRK